MKNRHLIILVVSLFFGIASTSHAVNPYSNYASSNSQNIQKSSTQGSAGTILNYSEVLLMSSWVERNLKNSDNQTDVTNFEKANENYRGAFMAYNAGNYAETKRLSLESIRVIASSVSRHNLRVAQADHDN